MGPTHPESPRRLEALIELLDSPQVADLNLLRVGERLADEAEIVRVHTGDYWRRIADSEGHHVQLDPDTRASPRSFEAARRASGAALQAFDAVLRGDARNGFALVRPPGHHAEAYSAMGFCLFNSVAIVAQHARAVHGLERIAIIDFDVHHGNGTQAAFWDDPNTLFISSHQFPFYPGTGAAFEVGGSSA
ncbi:MAG: acetoin utilization deacetylase AcuC-like enzyme, partial [Myxococcota bacterium]